MLPKKKSLQDLSDAARQDESEEEELLRESDYSAGEEEEGVEDMLMDEPPKKTASKAKKMAVVRKRHEDSSDSELEGDDHDGTTPNAKPATTGKPRSSTAAPKPAAQPRRASTAAVSKSASSRTLAQADATDDDDDEMQATPKAFRIITPAPRASLAGGGAAKRRESGMVPLGVNHGNTPAVEAVSGSEPMGKKGSAVLEVKVVEPAAAGRRVSRRVTMGAAGGLA